MIKLSLCKIISRPGFLKNTRTFLSSAYKCQEVWEQRKRSELFSKIDYDDLYHQLDRNLQIGSRISMLDVDLFANGIDSDIYLNELEDILFKVRLNPETGLMPDRTMHAVIRYYMETNKIEDLLKVLSNRLGYGIFTDYYSSNFLMDDFLKNNECINASKIAVLQMLQEDFNHEILQKLSILSCIKYLNSSEIWVPPKEAPTNTEDEEEIERVRVSFIRNPYFDDHFDLINTNHLVGKTLYLAGTSSQGALELSSQIIGLTLHEKYTDLLTLLSKIKSQNEAVFLDSLVKAKEYLITPPKQEPNSSSKEVNEADSELKSKAVSMLTNMTKTPGCLEGDIESAAIKEVEKAVEMNEAKDIQELTKLYRQWETERDNHIQFEIRESNKKKTAAEIERTREEIIREEEKIFFFDRENEWMLKVEEKEEEIKQFAEHQSQSKKKKKEGEEYIPPEVGRKRE